jgi:hypothetical protein
MSGILDFLNKHFGENSDLPIQVEENGGTYDLYVEEKREPNQSSGRKPYQGISDDSIDDSD